MQLTEEQATLLINQEEELTESLARSLTPEQVKARKSAKIARLSDQEVIRLRQNGVILKHITELDHNPVEYYEFFWQY